MSVSLVRVCRHYVPALVLGLALAFASPVAAQLPTPEAHFGFRMGAERQLASAEAIERYFELVAASSDRVELIDIGPTTEGQRTIAAVVSSSENILHLTEIRANNQRLTDPRTLMPEEAHQLVSGHKVVVAIGGGIHASEVGASQASNELLHLLATSDDASVRRVLDNVVIILIPMLNPDGHRLVVDWYEQHKDSPFEGGPMPWMYHEFAGHDLNRDAFMMNMAESRNLAHLFYSEWHPQVFLTMHQMGTTGPRFFVPPNVDPIGPNYDPLIWRTAGLLGSAMALELQRDGRSGVVSNAIYDYYWPGYEDSAPLGHNTVSLLTEVASVNVATPLIVRPEELEGGLTGLTEYRQQINFPDPWPGGEWTLRDIVDYELSAVRGLLFAVSAYRERIVQDFYDMGRRAVEAGRRGDPFAFILPPGQFDPHAAAKLENLLIQGGIEVYRTLEPFRADGNPYPEGADIILMSQPFRAYVKTLLERQRYPGGRETAHRRPERPYDATGWTLPAMMGVDVRTIERYFQVPAMTRLASAAVPSAIVWGERRPDFYVIDGRANAGAIAANRLAAMGARAAWITETLIAGGYSYPPGSLIVQHTRLVEPVVADIAANLGLRVDGVRGRQPAGTISVGGARTALYRPWVANTDEGWIRWLFETYEFPFTSITDADVRAGSLQSKFDVIVLPNAEVDSLVAGHATGTVPPEYAGGLGDAGAAELRTFVENGGTLVCLDESCELPIRSWHLPLSDVVAQADDTFFCPGSLLRLEVDTTQPLGYGMPSSTVGYFASSSAYELAASGPGDGPSPRSVARYTKDDLLVSGWLEGGEAIAGRTAVAEVPVGKGRLVALGFRAQHRGQTQATFRLLFNSILTSQPSTP